MRSGRCRALGSQRALRVPGMSSCTRIIIRLRYEVYDTLKYHNCAAKLDIGRQRDGRQNALHVLCHSKQF